MKMRGAATAVALGLALAGGTATAQGKPASSTRQFKYKGGRIEPGMLYSYVRSDLAGTKTGSVLVYVPDRKRVEILRVSPGVEGGRLLTGEMNWDTYTLRQFELWNEGKDGGRKRLATGTFSAEALTVNVEDPALYRGAPGATTFSVPLVQLPAHIYSLDFITLGLALRHFADPLGSVDVGVLAENLKVGPGSPDFLVSAGKATVSFVEDVDRDGIVCMKYRITGPALGAEEGLLWLHKEKGYIQDAEIPVPSSPEWPDVKLTLRSAEKISAGDWPARRTLEIGAIQAK
ncbi:MAG: hypothetical protein IPL90_03270 [Holophagales bacterium]|nr:hypothetical protein [Holophagales bacterium]